jgi:hypothetical protein
MTKYILVTGANGQLGHELQNVLNQRDDITTYFTDVEELDITNKESIHDFFKDLQIDYLVNCAAYTAVDKAEDDIDFCQKLNADSVKLLAEACKEKGAKMIQISTDYVFNGENDKPYLESDPPAPCSIYGITKLEGEKNMQELLPDAIIVRTAWLYSPYGHNFVKTMLHLGKTRESLNVVNDQWGTPTYALDLAHALIAIIDAPHWEPGIYHYSNEGTTTWFDFAVSVHRHAGITSCAITPCSTAQYPTVAHRPRYSVLSKEKIKKTYKISIPNWEESLKHCLQRIDK